MLLKIYSVKPRIILYFTLFLSLFTANGVKTPAVQLPGDFKQPLVKCWELSNPNLELLASDNELLLALSNDGTISNIDLKDPIELWKISNGSKKNITFKIISNRIFVISDEFDRYENNSVLISEIDKQSGLAKKVEEIKDSRILNGNQFSTDQNPQTRLLLQTGSKAEIIKKLISIDIASLQQFDFNEKISGEDLLVTQNGSSSYIFDRNTILENRLSDGSWLRSINSETENITAALSLKNDLIWGDQKGILYKLNQKINTPSKILRTGGRISSIRLLEENILVVSDDNFLYLYSPENKKVIWKKRMPGRVNISPVFSSNTILVTTTAEPRVYLIDMKDGKVFNQIQTDENIFIKDLRVNNAGIFVLTDAGLLKYSGSCGK